MPRRFSLRLRRRRAGYRQRASAYKRTRFAKGRANRRRRGRLSYLRKGTAKKRAVNFYKSKSVQAARSRVGLPKLEIKHVEDVHIAPGTQWAVFNGATIWSDYELLDTLSTGTTNLTRESRIVKWLPATARLEIAQIVSQEYMYRIMLIQVRDNIDMTNATTLKPEEFLMSVNTASNALRSTYLYKQDRGDSNTVDNFHVWFDKTINFNSFQPKGTSRTIRIPVPGHTVTYDADDSTGHTGTNKMFICVVTDAPTASADYLYSISCPKFFLDQ